MLLEATERTAMVSQYELSISQEHLHDSLAACADGESLHDASARSSFFRLILSFRPSASRLAAAILACICSPDISEDMVKEAQLRLWM